MKKLLQTLLMILAAQAVFAQCQADFTYYHGNGASTLFLNDNSFNPSDSNQLTITNSVYTVQFSGTSTTYTGNDVQVNVGTYTGVVYVCHTITTSVGCTSTFCDSITLSYIGPHVCYASFLYDDNFTDTIVFHAQYYSSYPSSVTYTYYWTFSGGTPSTSTLENPIVAFPDTGSYNVCLTITSDSCTDIFCADIFVWDSIVFDTCNLSFYGTINNVSTIGGHDGYIDLTVSGGNPPYQYDWNTGDTTQDIYGLYPGIYTVNILQTGAACPASTATFQIIEPYDTIPLDTLYIPPIDTCLNFVPDSFYVTILYVDSTNATVTWTFANSGMVSTFTVTYSFQTYGPYVIAFSFNCDSAKGLTTYMTYVNFTEYLGVEENQFTDYNIFPNPFENRFEILVPGGVQKVMIYNSMGQLVWSADGIDTEKLSVDAADWPFGSYFVKLSGNQGNASRVLIKQ